MSYLEEESKKSSQSHKEKVNIDLNVRQGMIVVFENSKIECNVRTSSRADETLLEDLLLGDQSTKQNDD